MYAVTQIRRHSNRQVCLQAGPSSNYRFLFAKKTLTLFSPEEWRNTYSAKILQHLLRSRLFAFPFGKKKGGDTWKHIFFQRWLFFLPPRLLFLLSLCRILRAVTPVCQWLGSESISSLSDRCSELRLLPFRPRCCASRRYTQASSRTSWAVRSASPSRRASAATQAASPTVSPRTSEYGWRGWGLALPRSAGTLIWGGEDVRCGSMLLWVY